MIVAATIAAYWGGWHNGFVYDDHDLIEKNSLIQEQFSLKKVLTTGYWETTRGVSNYYRPLTILSLKLDHSLYGDKPAGFHISNLLWHISCALLLYLLALQWQASPEIALVAALVFAVTPFHTQSVAWISGRTDVLATTAALLALICFRVARLRGKNDNPLGRWLLFTAAGVLYFVGLLAKEIIIALPLVVLVQEVLLRPAPPLKRPGFWLPWGVFIPGLVVCFYLRYQIINSLFFFVNTPEAWWVPADGQLSRLATVPKILSWYLLKSVFPWPLVFERGVEMVRGIGDWTLYLGLIGLGGWIYGIRLCLRRGARQAAAGLACFLTALLPIANIVPVFEPCMEHFSYFPGIGFALFAAFAWMALRRRFEQSRVLRYTIVAPLIVFAVSTQDRVTEWQDDLTIFRDTAAKRPHLYRAQTSYGLALLAGRHYTEAIVPLKQAVELKPTYGRPHYNLGLAYRRLGRNELAQTAFENAIECDPTLISPMNNLGVIHYERGEYGKAGYYWQSILKIDPDNHMAKNNLMQLRRMRPRRQ